MQKRLIGISLMGSLLIILASFKFYDTFMMFLLVGRIPGTDQSLSPLAMVLLLVGVSTLFVTLLVRPNIISQISLLSQYIVSSRRRVTRS